MSARSINSHVLLRIEDSAGVVSAIEVTAPPRWEGPPLHHHDFDEAFYVLAGELTFQLGEDLLTAGPGALVFAPPGSHTRSPTGPAPKPATC